MRIKIKEKNDSHGNYVEHIIDAKEELDKIEFNNAKNTVTVTYTTVNDETEIKLNWRLDYILMEKDYI